MEVNFSLLKEKDGHSNEVKGYEGRITELKRKLKEFLNNRINDMHAAF